MPSTLFREFARIHSPAVRAKGERYHREGRVTAIGQVEHEVQATVTGTEPYQVRLRANELGVLDPSCTCPAWLGMGECKHVYAALLEADRLDLLSVVEAELIARANDRPPSSRAPTARPPTPLRPAWAVQLKQLAVQTTPAFPPPARPAQTPAAERRLVYLVSAQAAAGSRWLALRLATQARKKSGDWGPYRAGGVHSHDWEDLATEDDRAIAHVLMGAAYGGVLYGTATPSHFALTPEAAAPTLARCCATGRCLAERGGPLVWDAGPPWRLALEVGPEAAGDWYRVQAAMIRDAARIPLTGAIIADGVFMAEGTAARWEGGPATALAGALAAGTELAAPPGEVADLIGHLVGLNGVSEVTWPDTLNVQTVRESPRVALLLVPVAPRAWSRADLKASLIFAYGGQEVRYHPETAGAPIRVGTRIYPRDVAAEAEAIARLLRLGARWEYNFQSSSRQLCFDPQGLPTLVPLLLADGWRIEVSGKSYRSPSDRHANISTGIDWFELAGHVDYGDQRAELPQLLAAARRGERFVTLGDGSQGLVPADWLAKLTPLVGSGTLADGGIRFTTKQVVLLDALLAVLPEVDVDQQLDRARRQLASFAGIKPLPAPRSFRGTLRGYQREALGWLAFLRTFGFGGCLADDMGLGKTVEVLAYLDRRRLDGAPPSLAVVPRSLVFNWQREAAQFTPKLRVLDHSGVGRRKTLEHLPDYDLILTTYGTLRRDAEQFRQVTFDCVILDEAQAIKNPASASAKAARLLQGDQRLALTGTPIENHLGELASLFEFLNPGMLGRAPGLTHLLTVDGDGESAQGAATLARAVRPFILRRTKEQVAPELPPRQEQTLLVTLDPAERKQYDELRDHYRATLLARIDREGIGRSRIQVLEALLRLRQAACHPGLLDPARVGEGSSKIDLLLEQLDDVVQSGHKALVFSQFTTLLGIVRPRLDARGLRYEYLDGSTKDRQARVDRFQTATDCPLFLISLKAGGVGLNLTAADYVFLLDPWWNPAVEAQAIDRTHRIGQTRRVLATRLIARDTVEERVIELQQRKRTLADAVLGEQNAAMGRIGREELERLLA